MNRLALLRYEQGLSQDEVAKACNVSSRTIARFEAGKTVPTARVAKALADTYKVTVGELLGVEEAA